MKRILFNTTLTLICLPLLALASNPKWQGRYTKEKKINKEFQVNPDALLEIENSYGNLYLTSWNENRVVIEVHIKTNSDNESKAQKKLDEISVSFENNPGMVSAKTKFEKSSWNWSWGGNNNVSMEVNYIVKLPRTNRVDLSNDYGSINLDKLDGKAVISCDYGRIDIGELNHSDNEISFDYTSKSAFGYIKGGEIRADYSTYEVEEAERLTIAADYTNSTLKKVNTLNYACDYGSMKVEEVNNIEGRADYLSTKIGTVHGDLNISSDYGSIRIDELAADAGNVQISTDYTGIRIGYNSGYHFDFEINTEYAGISGDTDFDYDIVREKSSEKYYKGYYGSKGKNTMRISSDYGSIKMSKQ
ncbi:hypothetical protein [Robertkochia aurantiaca]|uniref:hypothetical protein n=1 Tax=Robertkochia aurantiaca TaxID=2873700 RepID=UPI001CCB68C7|nr:hypothetical protein [Robertkochia sp. 3YJGBD-33]